MNKEQTVEAIKVMTAYVDGAEIESNWGQNKWCHLTDGVVPGWDWTKADYRIKPKLREFWITDPGASSDVLVALVNNENDKDQRNWIKVREI